MRSILQFLLWHLWGRWRIYCPKYSVAHLFDQNRRLVFTPYGLMEFHSEEQFHGSLFLDDEAFMSPCVMNPDFCGGLTGKWIPKIGFVPPMEMNE